MKQVNATYLAGLTARNYLTDARHAIHQLEDVLPEKSHELRTIYNGLCTTQGVLEATLQDIPTHLAGEETFDSEVSRDAPPIHITRQPANIIHHPHTSISLDCDEVHWARDGHPRISLVVWNQDRRIVAIIHGADNNDAYQRLHHKVMLALQLQYGTERGRVVTESSPTP